LLADEYNVIRSPKSFNRKLRSLSVGFARQWCRHCIIEAGYIATGEMKLLQRIVKPILHFYQHSETHQSGIEIGGTNDWRKAELFVGTDEIIYTSYQAFWWMVVSRAQSLCPLPGHEGWTPTFIYFVQKIPRLRPIGHRR
jgi:hypothetical protein